MEDIVKRSILVIVEHSQCIVNASQAAVPAPNKAMGNVSVK